MLLLFFISTYNFFILFVERESGHKASTSVSNSHTASQRTSSRAKKSRPNKGSSSTQQEYSPNSVGMYDSLTI